jgi:hypothetical protein
MTSPGMEPATFWLVAYCLNQLRYRVPPNITQYRRSFASQYKNVVLWNKLYLVQIIKKMPTFYGTPEVHYHVHKSLSISIS